MIELLQGAKLHCVNLIGPFINSVWVDNNDDNENYEKAIVSLMCLESTSS